MSEIRFRHRSFAGRLAASLALCAPLALGGCSYPDWANPIEWYRDVTGSSQNDPKGDEPYTKNLQAGSEEPYPNLGSVPPPPTNALSSAEREKLRQSLIADRANAKYVDNNDQYSVTAPQSGSAPAATPLSTPPGTAPSGLRSSTTPTPVSTTAAGPPGTSNSPSIAAEPVRPNNSRRSGLGGAGNPSTTPRSGPPAPQESSLRSPTVGSVPQGDQPRAVPPAPGSPASPSVPQTARAPVASPSAPAAASTPQGVAMTVGIVTFVGTSTRLDPTELQRIREAAQLRQQNGGVIRVTAYSEPSDARDLAAAELAGFGLALDRARVVALALTNAGVPARAVQIGASPAPPGERGGTAALTLEY